MQPRGARWNLRVRPPRKKRVFNEVRRAMLSASSGSRPRPFTAYATTPGGSKRGQTPLKEAAVQ